MGGRIKAQTPMALSRKRPVNDSRPPRQDSSPTTTVNEDTGHGRMPHSPWAERTPQRVGHSDLSLRNSGALPGGRRRALDGFLPKPYRDRCEESPLFFIQLHNST